MMPINNNLNMVLSTTSLLLATYLVGMSQAFAAPEPQMTKLHQLISTAIKNNPSLKVKKLAWQSIIQKYPQATALNDPQLVYSESLRPVETRNGPIDRTLSLSQKLPYPGKLAVKGDIVKQEVKIAKMRYDVASRDLVISLKKSFHELVYLENALRLSLKNKVLLEKITHVANTGYATNANTLNDVAKAQSQYAQVSYDVQLLEELRSTEKTQINTLLNRNPEQIFNVNAYVRQPAKLPHSLKKLYQWAESNEELQIVGLDIEKSAFQQKLANYSSLPDFNLGLRYTQIGTSGISGLERNSRDGIAVSIGVNIPLNIAKNNAIKAQARLNQQRKIMSKKALENSLKNNVKKVYFKLNNSHRLITLYGKNLIPQANRAMHVAEIQYKENKGSITNYLGTQSTWLNFQLAYHRAIADYAKNLTEMERLTGRTL